MSNPRDLWGVTARHLWPDQGDDNVQSTRLQEGATIPNGERQVGAGTTAGIAANRRKKLCIGEVQDRCTTTKTSARHKEREPQYRSRMSVRERRGGHAWGLRLLSDLKK